MQALPFLAKGVPGELQVVRRAVDHILERNIPQEHNQQQHRGQHRQQGIKQQQPAQIITEAGLLPGFLHAYASLGINGKLHGDILASADLEKQEQRQHRRQRKDGGQRGGRAIAGANNLVVDGHGHGPRVRRVEHDRGAQLVDKRDPAQDGAGNYAGQHQLGRYLHKGFQRRIAQRDGGLLYAGADLIENGRAGTQRVGQTANHQGDNHDGCRAGKHHGVTLAVEGQKQRNTKHRAGNDVGEHGDGINRTGEHAFFAHRQVGDQHAEHNNYSQGNDAIQVSILNRGQCRVKNLGVAFKGVAVHEVLYLRFAQGGPDDDQVRHHGKNHQEVGEHMHDDVLGALCARGLNGAHGAHGEALLVHVPLLQKEQHRRDHHHQRSHGRGEVGRAAGFAYKLDIDFGGQHVVSLADEGRGAEVRHAVHEHQQR